MKTILVRAGVILVMVLLGVFLFISGKEHVVYLANKGKSFTPKNVYYVLDGQKEVRVKRNKKKRGYVKGTTHIIEVRFEGQDGVEKKIIKEFETKMGEKNYINVALIESDSEWFKSEKIEEKKK